jgi:hypothetical protein
MASCDGKQAAASAAPLALIIIVGQHDPHAGF